MGKIIAIGGGEIGRPGFPIETTKIDNELIKLTGKKRPRLLFVPTASSDAEGYVDVVYKYFGKKLGCKIDTLYLIKGKVNKKNLRDKIFSSDIIYVGGGDTLKMLKIWKKFGVDKLLISAYKKGIILSGLSAGAICWFAYGNSDSLKFFNKKAGYIKIKGLGLIKATGCPHYNVEKGRKKSLKEMMKKMPGIAIALDNCAAIFIIGNKYKIITSKKKAGAYKIYWKDKKYYEEKIAIDKEFKPLKGLLRK